MWSVGEYNIYAATPVEALSNPSLTAMHWLEQIAVMIDCMAIGMSTNSKAHFWEGGSASKIECRFGKWSMGGPRIAAVGRGMGLKCRITACRWRGA